MDINKQPETPVDQPVQPAQWTWIAQRKAEDTGTGSGIWKLGFIAPDGAAIHVTFHQIAQTDPNPQPEPDPMTQAGMPPAASPNASGMSPVAPPDTTGQGNMPAAPPALQPEPLQAPAPSVGFAPQGQPNTDQTENSTFYVTFFSNRHPEFFMKYDTGLSHEDSLTLWVTITHGIVDFVRKAQPSNVILDDLANGKLKMILRSVALDIATANPEYELEQTHKHHYRTFFQVRRREVGSAFADEVQGKSSEGDTATPQQPSPITGPQKPQDQSPDAGATSGGNEKAGDKTEDPTTPQPDDPAFPSSQQIPIKQTPLKRRGLTVEIGKDYSVAVRDEDRNVIDRYRGKNPADILRWINEKGYGTGRMTIIDKEQPSMQPGKVKKPEHKSENKKPEQQDEQYQVIGKTVRVHNMLSAKQAALMNYIVNAQTVHCNLEHVEFEFETDRNIQFKRALVELAYERTKPII